MRYCAVFYALGLDPPHGRPSPARPRRLTPQVIWAGNLSTAIGITVVTLVLLGNRHAPLLAAVTGLPIALGVAAVHLLPKWSALSDTFEGARNTGVSPLSWTVVLIEIVGALAMGVVGFRIVREQRATVPSSARAHERGVTFWRRT